MLKTAPSLEEDVGEVDGVAVPGPPVGLVAPVEEDDANDDEPGQKTRDNLNTNIYGNCTLP